MKKQFLLLIIMLFTGVYFSYLKNTGLKACGTNAAGLVIKKGSVCNMQTEYIAYEEYRDASVHMFMNPFIPQ